MDNYFNYDMTDDMLYAFEAEVDIRDSKLSDIARRISNALANFAEWICEKITQLISFLKKYAIKVKEKIKLWTSNNVIQDTFGYYKDIDKMKQLISPYYDQINAYETVDNQLLKKMEGSGGFGNAFANKIVNGVKGIEDPAIAQLNIDLEERMEYLDKYKNAIEAGYNELAIPRNPVNFSKKYDAGFLNSVIQKNITWYVPKLMSTKNDIEHRIKYFKNRGIIFNLMKKHKIMISRNQKLLNHVTHLITYIQKSVKVFEKAFFTKPSELTSSIVNDTNLVENEDFLQ